MRKLYFLPFLLALLMAACASPKEESSSTASQQANASANTNASPGASNGQQPINVPSPDVGLPQPQTPPNGSPAVKPVPLPESATVTEGTPKPEPTGPAPKLLVPTKEIDFGKQPKDIALTRSILIKNGGKADLEIQSVSPS